MQSDFKMKYVIWGGFTNPTKLRISIKEHQFT
jgi:hypothetical protein